MIGGKSPSNTPIRNRMDALTHFRHLFITPTVPSVVPTFSRFTNDLTNVFKSSIVSAESFVIGTKIFIGRNGAELEGCVFFYNNKDWVIQTE